jgi:translation initiation factor IF-3
MFRGRENAHPELGLRLLEKMSDSLKEIASVEKQPIKEGARLHIILVPQQSAVKTKAKEEVKQEEDAKT